MALDLIERRNVQLDAEAEMSEAERELASEYNNLWGKQRGIVQISLADIREYRTADGLPQPYKIRDWKIDAISASMEDIGVLQPLVVRSIDDKNYKYEVLCGHHRFYAARRLEFASVPCEVRNVSDEEAFKIVSESNPPKEDDVPFPSENARIYATYLARRGSASEEKTVESIARKFNTSVRTIYRLVRVLELPQLLIDAVDNKKFPLSGVEQALDVFSKSELEEIGKFIVKTSKKVTAKIFSSLLQMKADEVIITVAEIEAFLEAEKEKALPMPEPTEPEEESRADLREIIRASFPALEPMSDADLDTYILVLLNSNNK